MNPAKEDLQAWQKVINKTAKFVAADFPGVEPEDLAQELWVFVTQTNKIFDPTSPTLPAMLAKIAKRIAWDQRKKDLYATAQYNYRPSDVRLILRTALDRTRWPDTFVPDDAREIDRLDQFDLSADIKWGYTQLPYTYRHVIFRHFVCGDEFESGSADRRRLYRAVDKLTEALNFYRKPNQSASRRASMNNTTARSIIDSQNGD